MSDVKAAKSAKWAAEMLGCDLSRIYKLLRGGYLEGYRDGRAVRVYEDSIALYQRSNEIRPARDVTSEPRRYLQVNRKAYAEAIANLRAMGALPD